MNINIVLCVVLSIVTCGIYGIYWFVKMTDETNDMTGSTVASGIVAFLLSIVTCGIYAFYWNYKMGEKVDQINGTPSNSGILFLILALFGLSIVNYCIIQNAINNKVAPQI